MLRRTLIQLKFAAAVALLAGCAALSGGQALRVSIVDIDAADGEGLEIRLLVKLRLQNPNETAIDYDGAALDLEVDGRRLASGVSSARGSVPRFGEAVLAVPVTVSAFGALRQAFALADGRQRDSLPYVLVGRLSTGPLGSVRFSERGELSWAALRR